MNETGSYNRLTLLCRSAMLPAPSKASMPSEIDGLRPLAPLANRACRHRHMDGSKLMSRCRPAVKKLAATAAPSVNVNAWQRLHVLSMFSTRLGTPPCNQKVRSNHYDIRHNQTLSTARRREESANSRNLELDR